MKKPSEEYVEKAKLLSEEETERLMARMRTKLMRRLEDKKMSVPEVVAIQMEIEDEDLTEWRAKMAEMRKTEERKKSKGK
jgi:RIO-like serine/threonine protein kinase